ncbi:MAG: DUF4159 domain-containing protein [Bacteroidetes bacterium]|nr:DUF4159 domain-containing protein [Bacteroidota bacterium]
MMVLVLCGTEVMAQADYGFRFVRVRYEIPGMGGRGQGWGRGGGPMWAHDYPVAEQNFYIALKRTTTIHVEEPYLVLNLMDPQIFEHPILYLCEPGYWQIADEEVEQLREYLNRGGFLLFDDFRGDYEWYNLYEQMQRVLPGREPMELPATHPIWSIYFDVDPVAAPSLVSGYRGSITEDRYMGYFDDNGRLMALANHNQDIGDGWEYPDRDFENASTISFQMGINFVMYALTH